MYPGCGRVGMENSTVYTPYPPGWYGGRVVHPVHTHPGSMVGEYTRTYTTRVAWWEDTPRTYTTRVAWWEDNPVYTTRVAWWEDNPVYTTRVAWWEVTLCIYTTRVPWWV